MNECHVAETYYPWQVAWVAHRLTVDSEFKEEGARQVKHGIFQSRARKGGLLDLKHDRGGYRLLSFALVSCVHRPVQYSSVCAHSSPKTRHPQPPQKPGHVSLEYLISCPTFCAWRVTAVTHR